MTARPLSREVCRQIIEQQLFKPQSTWKAADAMSAVGRVGVELEAFPYFSHQTNGVDAKPAFLFGDKNSVIEALLNVSEKHGGVAKYWHPDTKYPGYASQVESIDFPDGDKFFFEPAGQVEISTMPCTTIEKLARQISDKQAVLDMMSDQSNIHFAQFGTNPWWGIDAIPNQLRKPRYLALERYLNRIGPYGRQMMMQTCSMHINLDIGTSSETRTKRIIAANLLAPFATALFANSSVSEGRANGYRSYRSYLWQQLDTTRTGILPLDRLTNKFSEDALIDLYLDFVLKAPVIYISELGEQALQPDMTFGYWMDHPVAGLSPGIPHLINHISLLFPEVRLKGYLEIRSVDAPPRQWQLIPILFYTGLLYNEKQLDNILELLFPMSAGINDLYARATLGLNSEDIFSTSKELMHMAIEGLSGLPEDFKEAYHLQQLTDFFEHFTSRRKTFADEQRDTFIIPGALA